MIEALAIPKGKAVAEPKREPDMVSKRGKAYWFGPEWVRETGKGHRKQHENYGRILPAMHNNSVKLHVLSKVGNLSLILGSIQDAFYSWHLSNKNNTIPWRKDFEVDCILLGMEPSDLLLSDWEYEDL